MQSPPGSFFVAYPRLYQHHLALLPASAYNGGTIFRLSLERAATAMPDQPSAPEPIKLSAFGLTDQGRVRDNNEDNFLISASRHLFVVSDGMGGQQAGERASHSVIKLLPQLIDRHRTVSVEDTSPTMARVVRRSIIELNEHVRGLSFEETELRGMGATLALVWVVGARAHLATLGDSRIYLLRKSRLDLMTDDHTIAGALVKHGEITHQQAREHAGRNALLKFIGMDGDAIPDQKEMTLKAGDRLLVCSDGLSGMISDEDIQQILLDHSAPEAACHALIAAANEAGGRDNVTALVINYGS